MSIRYYVSKNSRRLHEQGALRTVRSMAREGVVKSLLRPYLAAEQAYYRKQLPSQQRLLYNLRQRDNYLLIVLDAGRYDYLEPLLRTEFKTSGGRCFSAARDTFEWISDTWVGDYTDVTYVTGMVPISRDVPEFDADGFVDLYHSKHWPESLGSIIEVWDTDWDSRLGTTPPENVTDRALEYVDRRKLVVHYSQPHTPYVGMPMLLGHSNNQSATPRRGEPVDKPLWDRVETGEVSDHELRMAYQGNAVRAVRSLHRLVSTWDGRVVVTADHGEALGEWGMYAHDRAPHVKRRVVPWLHINGVRERGADDVGEMDGGRTVGEKLAALGYR